MDLLAIIGGAIVAVIGVVAGIVQVIQYLEQRREKKIVAIRASTESTPPLPPRAEPSRIETELRLQEKREKAEESAQAAEFSEISLALAELNRITGDLEKAKTYYQAAKAFFLSINDREKLARALAGLAAVYTAKGNHSAAIAIVKEVQGLTKTPRILAESKLRLGICYRRRGEYLEALNHLNESLEMSVSLSDNTLAGEVLIAKGDVYRKLNKWAEAEQAFLQSIETLKPETSHNPNNELAQIHLAQAKYALGRIYIEQKRYEEAGSLLTESFQSLEEIGNFYGIEICSQFMGRLHKAKGDWDEARRWYYESLVANSVTRNDLGRVETLFHLAEIAYLDGKSIRAQALASTSAYQAKEKNFPNQFARLSTLQGHIYCDASIFDEATRTYKEAIVAALRASPVMVDEIFSRLSEKLRAISAMSKKKAAEHIVRNLIEWWPTATVDGKKAEQVENEQMPIKAEIQEKPKRVSSHLLDLLDSIIR